MQVLDETPIIALVQFQRVALDGSSPPLLLDLPVCLSDEAGVQNLRATLAQVAANSATTYGERIEADVAELNAAGHKKSPTTAAKQRPGSQRTNGKTVPAVTETRKARAAAARVRR
jgi:hypothetical protein